MGKHPKVEDRVRVVRSNDPERVGTEGVVVDYQAVDWQSKVQVQPDDGGAPFWVWTWDVEVIPNE